MCGRGCILKVWIGSVGGDVGGGLEWQCVCVCVCVCVQGRGLESFAFGWQLGGKSWFISEGVFVFLTSCRLRISDVCAQDGSCNGLQHYAALGRDKAGAQSVNLWPYDRPQDVYSDVCELVS